MKAPPLAGTALAGPPSPATRPAEANPRKRVEALAEEDRLPRQENESLRGLVAEAGVNRRPAAASPAPASRPAEADLSAAFDVDEVTARQWQKNVEATIRERAGRRPANRHAAVPSAGTVSSVKDR